MISVVIPAHNEEHVIERCLQAITSSSEPGEFDVVVVCNGCTDRTAELATRFRPEVNVITTPTASKPLALNLGDAEARGFPRLYVDADVELTTAAIRQVAAALEPGGPLVAAPRRRLDLSGRPWRVRAYYRVWCEVPGVRDQIAGSGVYAVSELGRARFAAFPDIIADDAYVPALFAPHERVIVNACTSVVHPPTTLGDLIRAKTRSFAGNTQLLQLLGPGARPLRAKGSGRFWYQQLLDDPRRMPSVVIYVGVNLAAKTRARRRIRRGAQPIWDRDERSRSGA